MLGLLMGITLVALLCALLLQGARRFPRTAYFLYRFSGLISVCFAARFVAALAEVTYRPGFIDLYLACFFYVVWYCKLTARTIRSSRTGLIFRVFRLYIVGIAIVAFPVGLFAMKLHDLLDVKRTHGASRPAAPGVGVGPFHG